MKEKQVEGKKGGDFTNQNSQNLISSKMKKTRAFIIHKGNIKSRHSSNTNSEIETPNLTLNLFFSSSLKRLRDSLCEGN